MKKTIFAICALAMVVVLLPSCSEKFSNAAPYKSITIVYGLLGKTDTAHYIRIQKAYLDADKSALVMAKEADSNFFSNIDVKMAKVSMTSGNILAYYPMSRVDLNLEGYTKEEGIFFNTPNYAYKFKENLDPRFIYRLLIANRATGEVDSGEAPVIEDDNLSTFHIGLIDDSGALQQKLNFTSTRAGTYYTIDGFYNPPSYFSFQGTTSPVAILQAFLRFHYVDSNTQTNTKTRRYFDMDLGYTQSSPAFKYKLMNTDVYGAFVANMGTAPQYVYRLIDRCEMSVYLGTPDFNTYITVQGLQSVGLTGSEIQPNYTNLKGKNVLGLYTSRGFRKGYVTIDDNTISALVNNPDIANLRIRGTAY